MATNQAVQGAVGFSEKSAGKGLRIALWIAQGVLVAAFGMAGLIKLTQPFAELAKSMPAPMPEALVRFIGVCEIAGALGLILPAATRIKPVLTPWAAVGLGTVMVLAAIVNVSHGAVQTVPVNVVLGGLAAFVATGRFGSAR
jgi:putative oxidoreductase